ATAASTLVPSIVPLEHLDRANGRMVTAEIAGSEFIGPPLGGFLFGVAPVLPFAVNGGTPAIAVALVACIPALLQTPDPAVGTEAARPQARAVHLGRPAPVRRRCSTAARAHDRQVWIRALMSR